MGRELVEFLAMLEQYTTIAASFCAIIGSFFTAVGYLSSKIFVGAKKRKIQKCLSLQKKECKIVLPSYNKKLYNPNTTEPMCHMGDIKAASNIIDLIRKTGLYSHQNEFFYEDTTPYPPGFYNLFYIGGLLANKYTLDIFSRKFPKFKILASQDKIQNNPNNVPHEFFIKHDKNGFFWGDPSVTSITDDVTEKFEVEENERYAIIVKLSNKDFGNDEHGTVYILFGHGVGGTMAISRYLLSNYNDLYRRVKGKDHYFVAFKASATGAEIDGSTFLDLTDAMFEND